jgi:TPR repeat protein
VFLLAASRPARAEKVDVEDLVGDGSLPPATLHLISDAVRAAILRRATSSRLELLAVAPGPGPRVSCDLGRAAARSVLFLFCGDYGRVGGSVVATLKLVAVTGVSGQVIGTQMIEGSAKELLSKVDAAVGGLISRGKQAGSAASGPAGAAPQGGQVDNRAACQRGDARACIEVARSYGIMKNPAQAHPWVKRACDLKNAQACAVMGEAYERGYGLPVDYGMASRLYDFSCTAGDGDACCSFGRMMVDGRGVGRDVPRAKYYFDRGCQLGSGIACTDAGYWASRPLLQTGMFPNYRAALADYEKACELSEANGCNNLGGFYEQGLGGAAVDYFRAQHYYERACSLGRSESCADRDRMAKVNSERDVHVYIHHRH